jgi:hypothetical protein
MGLGVSNGASGDDFVAGGDFGTLPARALVVRVRDGPRRARRSASMRTQIDLFGASSLTGALP